MKKKGFDQGYLRLDFRRLAAKSPKARAKNGREEGSGTVVNTPTAFDSIAQGRGLAAHPGVQTGGLRRLRLSSYLSIFLPFYNRKRETSRNGQEDLSVGK